MLKGLKKVQFELENSRKKLRWHSKTYCLESQNSLPVLIIQIANLTIPMLLFFFVIRFPSTSFRDESEPPLSLFPYKSRPLSVRINENLIYLPSVRFLLRQHYGNICSGQAGLRERTKNFLEFSGLAADRLEQDSFGELLAATKSETLQL